MIDKILGLGLIGAYAAAMALDEQMERARVRHALDVAERIQAIEAAKRITRSPVRPHTSQPKRLQPRSDRPWLRNGG